MDYPVLSMDKDGKASRVTVDATCLKFSLFLTERKS
jgi:hypothetical protein